MKSRKIIISLVMLVLVASTTIHVSANPIYHTHFLWYDVNNNSLYDPAAEYCGYGSYSSATGSAQVTWTSSAGVYRGYFYVQMRYYDSNGDVISGGWDVSSIDTSKGSDRLRISPTKRTDYYYTIAVFEMYDMQNGNKIRTSTTGCRMFNTPTSR